MKVKPIYQVQNQYNSNYEAIQIVCNWQTLQSCLAPTYVDAHCDPGQRADTSYLDPIKVEDAPAEAIRLAAAELALRMMEERRRREVGLGKLPDVKHLRMTGTPGINLHQMVKACKVALQRYSTCTDVELGHK